MRSRPPSWAIAVMLVLAGCSSSDAGTLAGSGSLSTARPDSTVLTDPPVRVRDSDGGQADDAMTPVERALDETFEDPLSGGECRSIAGARQAAGELLTKLGLDGWKIVTDRYAREDGCATVNFRETGSLLIGSTVRPDVYEALEAFREHSYEACLDSEAARRELTAALEAVGHRDFVVKQEAGLSGPIGREEEIMAHADAGCVMYAGQGAEEDGTIVYFLSGG